MSSRDKDVTAPHQPLLSSLVVRPTDSGGGGGGGSDYEPGEVRRDPPPYSRSDRFDDDNNSHGYRMRAGSVSPVRRRNGSHHYSPDYDHSDGAPPARNRGFGRGRESDRYRDYSPPSYGRGRFGGGGRFGGRGGFHGGRGGFHGGSSMGGRGFRGGGDVIPRNNPNVRPREGDWMCTDPTCNNLNFARRENCNNCNRSRYAPPGSPPRRGYPGPPLMPRRFPGPPLDRSPGRSFNNGYRSPPRGFGRDGPRDFGVAGPPLHGRFQRDHHRPDYFEDELRDRNNRFDRPMVQPPEWGRDRKGYDRRPLSPPGPAPASPLPVGRGGGRWLRDERERSRSPVRGGGPKDYRRDGYMDRGREERRGIGRDPY
ncbi:putative Zinc finger, RanBP2-type, TAF15/EWS/TLS family, Zinc finger, RanBP2-type superfamily [Helianthus anomalus]